MSHLGLSGMSEKIVLRGGDAIALWKAGKDAWNQWVEEHPEAEINFSGIDFGKHHENGAPISFSEYIFPKGDVDFSNAHFNKGNVYFKGTAWKGGCIFDPLEAKLSKTIDFSSISIDGELAFGVWRLQYFVRDRFKTL